MYSDSKCSKVSEIQAVQLGVCTQQDTKSAFILTATKTTTNGQPVVTFTYNVYKSTHCDGSTPAYTSPHTYDTTLVCVDVKKTGKVFGTVTYSTTAPQKAVSSSLEAGSSSSAVSVSINLNVYKSYASCAAGKKIHLIPPFSRTYPYLVLPFLIPPVISFRRCCISDILGDIQVEYL